MGINIRCSNSYPKISYEDIERLQTNLDVILPKQYIEFLINSNGGEPEHHDYKLNGEYDGDISEFYGILNQLSPSDIATVVEEYSQLIPKKYFPIGVSYGGDIICISLWAEEFGEIFKWDHETANYDGEPWLLNISKLAKDLEEFFAMLYTEE